jgi:hypothetical protein
MVRVYMGTSLFVVLVFGVKQQAGSGVDRVAAGKEAVDRRSVDRRSADREVGRGSHTHNLSTFLASPKTGNGSLRKG